MRNIITIIFCLTALSLSSFAQNSRDYIRKGNRLMRDSAYAKAQVQYQKAVEADNADSRAHYNLGNAMSLQSKAEDAMKEYQTAVKLEKNKNRLAQMYHNMGVIMQSAKQPDKALEFYKQSLRNNPHSEQTRYNYALCLHQLKKGGQDNQDQQQDENGLTLAEVPAADSILIEEENCDIVMALGMPGREEEARAAATKRQAGQEERQERPAEATARSSTDEQGEC